jgi:hypothetical protein
MSEPRGDLPVKHRLWPWDFAKILLETMLHALENQRVPGSLWENTILINVGKVHGLQLDLGHAEKERLFRCGYDQTRRYFRKKPASPPSESAS